MTSRVVLDRNASASKLNQNSYMRKASRTFNNQNSASPGIVYGEKKTVTQQEGFDISKSYDNLGKAFNIESAE